MRDGHASEHVALRNRNHPFLYGNKGCFRAASTSSNSSSAPGGLAEAIALICNWAVNSHAVTATTASESPTVADRIHSNRPMAVHAPWPAAAMFPGGSDSQVYWIIADPPLPLQVFYHLEMGGGGKSLRLWCCYRSARFSFFKPRHTKSRPSSHELRLTKRVEDSDKF